MQCFFVGEHGSRVRQGAAKVLHGRQKGEEERIRGNRSVCRALTSLPVCQYTVADFTADFEAFETPMTDQMTAIPTANTLTTPRGAAWLTRLLNPFMVVLTYLGEILMLLGQTVKAMRGGVVAKDLVEQMASLGVNSVGIAMLTTTTSGAVLALYFAPFLKQ